MIIDKYRFYNSIRHSLFNGELTAHQVSGIESIFVLWESRNELIDKRWLAYMLATVYHETAKTMQAIEEYGKGKTKTYGFKIKRSQAPYTTPNKIYYGRGKVQLTWYENYDNMGRILGIPLLENPDLALDDTIANKIMFEGMMKGTSSIGDFTGKSLDMYFNDKTDDPTNARRIINGLDHTIIITSYHNYFLQAL